jgi:hypothetical protein
MTWRVAKSLDQLLSQLNTMFPNRSKDSDGSIGDARHQAESSSDHNPWVHDGPDGVVTARDFTNDPMHGLNSETIANALLASKDERIKYVISNKKIASGTGQGHEPWAWRPYTGSNAHNHHVHVSVKPDKAHYDDDRPWTLPVLGTAIPTAIPTEPGTGAPPPAPVKKMPVLQQEDRGEDVAVLQRALGIKADGIFGGDTKKAVQQFQAEKGLTADGVVGPYTWEKLIH